MDGTNRALAAQVVSHRGPALVRESGVRPPGFDPGPVPDAFGAAGGIRNRLHVPAGRHAQQVQQPQGEDCLHPGALCLADRRLLRGTRLGVVGQKGVVMIPRHSLAFGVGEILSSLVSGTPTTHSTDL